MKRYLELFEKKKIVLIVSLPRNDPEMFDAAFESGADAVKMHVNLSHRASGNSFGSLEENLPAFERMFATARGPVGLVPGANVTDIDATLDAACALPFDFFSMYLHHAPARAALCPQALMGACGHGYTQNEWKYVSQVGADVLEASVMDGSEYGRRLSLRDIMTYRALCESTRLPVVVPTQLAIRPSEVAHLSRAGVRGIMIGAIVTGNDISGIAKMTSEFRAAIEGA